MNKRQLDNEQSKSNKNEKLIVCRVSTFVYTKICAICSGFSLENNAQTVIFWVPFFFDSPPRLFSSRLYFQNVLFTNHYEIERKYYLGKLHLCRVPFKWMVRMQSNVTHEHFFPFWEEKSVWGWNIMMPLFRYSMEISLMNIVAVVFRLPCHPCYRYHILALLFVLASCILIK